MPMIPFVKNGYYGNRNWIPLVNGNGLTAGGDEPEPEWETVGPASIVNFNTLREWPLQSLLVSMSPVQAAGTPSPDNPLPISGWSSLAVEQMGVNLCDFDRLCTGATLNVTSNRGTLTYDTTTKKLTCTISTTGSMSVECNIKPQIQFPVFGSDQTVTMSYYIKDGKPNSGGSLRSQITFSDNSTSNGNVSIPTGTGTYTRTFTIPAGLYIKQITLFASYTGNIETGDVVEFSDFRIKLGSSALEPYVPFSGTTVSVTFPALGANQWDEEWELGRFNTTTGENVPTTNQIRSKNKVPCMAGAQYYLVTTVASWLIFYDSNGDVIQTPDVPEKVGASGNSVSLRQGQFTAPTGAVAFKFYLLDTYGTTYNHDIAVNYPSTVTTYEPYTNTVYSGTLDVVTGVGEITWWIIRYAGDFAINMSASYIYETATRCYFNPNSLGYPKGANLDATKSNIAHRGGTLPDANRINYAINQNWLEINLRISNSLTGIVYGTDDVTSAKAKIAAYFADNPLDIVYPLETPIPIQLTPQEVLALVGENNCWSDADTVTVEYRKN